MNHRRRRQAGVIWIMVILFLFIVVIFATLGTDYGAGLMTKDQALSNSEESAVAALLEYYKADYQGLGVVDPNVTSDVWSSVYTQPDIARTYARGFSGGGPASLFESTDVYNTAVSNPSHHFELSSVDVGYTLRLYDKNNVEITAGNTGTMIAHFGDADASTPGEQRVARYKPDVQLNNAAGDVNNNTGDVVFGGWIENPAPDGDPSHVLKFNPNPANNTTILPTAMQVTIRRTYEAKQDGVREGNNSMAFTFGRAWGGFFYNPDDPQTPAALRNRGMRLVIGDTVGLVPAGAMGQGTAITRYQIDPSTRQFVLDVDNHPIVTEESRAGLMPLAIKLSKIQTLIQTADSTTTLTLDLDAGDAYLSDLNATFGPNSKFRINKIIDFLDGTEPDNHTDRIPPAVGLGDPIPQSTSHGNSLKEEVNRIHQNGTHTLEQCTWVVAVVQDAAVDPPTDPPSYRCVGFTHVYCVEVDPSSDPDPDIQGTIKLRLAPSTASRVGAPRQLPLQTSAPADAAVVANYNLVKDDFANTFWLKTTTATPVPFITRPYGVSCTPSTVQHTNINRQLRDNGEVPPP